MKICKICKCAKDESEFYSQIQRGKKGQAWPYLDCYCKSCRSTYTYERSIKQKKLAIQYKGGKCEDCGLIDEPCVFDFHHIDPDKKEYHFGGRGGLTFEKAKPELDKCILLCANCHRKRHNRRITYKE